MSQMQESNTIAAQPPIKQTNSKTLASSPQTNVDSQTQSSARRASLSRSPSVSLVKEKEHMENLNDRLALIIQKARQLEYDNMILCEKVGRYEETEREAKRERAELVKEKALLEIEVVEQKARASLAIERRNSILNDYQELYDIKAALDSEIALYRELLESEEERPSILSNVTPVKNGEETRENKKRHLLDDLYTDEYE